MELTNELHPSELFRYVHLRNARKPAAAESTIEFIGSQEIVPTPSLETLYNYAVAERNSETAYTNILARCADFKESSDYISSVESVYEILPHIKELIAALQTEIKYKENWELEVENILRTNITAYFAEIEIAVKKELLWNNLIYQIFTEGNASIVGHILQAISCIYLLENIGEISSDKGIKKLLNARVLLPEWVGTILKNEKQKKADVGVGDKSRVLNTTISRAARIHKAMEELSLLQSYKQHFIAEESLNPLVITENDLGRLSSDAQTLLQELNIPIENQSVYAIKNYLRNVEANEKSQTKSVAKNLVTRVGETLLRTTDACFEFEETDPCGENERKPFVAGGSYVNTLYVGDLLVTQQQLLRYDLGEVAHIENVMASEEKMRTHRRLDRSELTETSERETENETERETQTTERFSIEKEASKVLQQSLNLNASVTASATFGTVASLAVSSGFGYSNSSTESQNEATAFSKQVTDRALTRVKEHIRETRSLKIIKEIEETASHKFSNLATADGTQPSHINGVFRWVDKYYLNKVVNFGKRLMLEFTIPEPANFYIFRKVNKPAEGEQMTEPIHPSKLTDSNGVYIGIKDFTEINDTNYAFWAAQYGVTDVDIQPLGFQTVSKTLKLTRTSPDDAAEVFDKAVVPKGYWATTLHLAQNYYGSTPNVSTPFKIAIQVGSFQKIYDYVTPEHNISLPTSLMDGDTIPISVKVWGDPANHKIEAIVNVSITCYPTAEGILAWKQAVYAKLIDAYKAQKKEYDEWVNAQQAYAAYKISGNNPEINRQIEREELKKRCLEMFTGQRFESFDAATNGLQNLSNYPEIVFKEAVEEGRWVELFEQIFDWENITYAFYPYFYGRKQNWQVITKLSDNDPLFSNFLKAGYAKAIVPVRKGFEEYVMLYHLFSVAFIGGSIAQVPGVETDAYQTLLEDLHTLGDQAEHEAVYNEDNVIGTYIQKVPTNLVFLTADLPVGTPNTQKLTDNSSHSDIASYL